MSTFISKLKTFISHHQLILPGETIIAAVSGGLDSMVMLDALCRLKDDMDFHLAVIHVNHGIRGAESDGDETFVREVCRVHGLEVHCRRLNGFDLSAGEETLRNARYAEFGRVLQMHGPGARIATGHQLNDQLETFLMRLAGGATSRGLCAIPVRRERYIRPLLDFSRADIKRYAEKNGVKYRNDFTNNDEQKFRNRIRHRLVPVMEDSLGKDFLSGFRKSIRELQKTEKQYKKYVRDLFNTIAVTDETRIRFALSSFRSIGPDLRKDVIEYCVYPFYKVYSKPDSKNFYAFETFIETARIGSRFVFPGRIQCEKDRESLYFFRKLSRIAFFEELSPGNSVNTGRNIIRINAVSNEDFQKKGNPDEEFICGDGISFPLTVRSWKEGDRFVPLGLGKHQKVSDFFINQKVPLHRKDMIPVICDGKRIIWIAGYRLDDRFKVTDACNTVYKLTIERTDISEI